MGAPVVFISRNRVKEGKLEGFKKAYQETSERLNLDKPGTVAFLAYLSDDGAEVSIIHLFPDADAMDRHLEGVAERTKLAYEFIESAGMEVYGKLSDGALQTFKEIADSRLPVTFRPDHLGVTSAPPPGRAESPLTTKRTFCVAGSVAALVSVAPGVRTGFIDVQVTPPVTIPGRTPAHTLRMALVRRVFVALVCAFAIGSLATDLWVLDLFGPQVSVFAALPLLSYAIVGALLVVRREPPPIRAPVRRAAACCRR